ncbi:Pleckstrin homology-like domain [Plasmopara halstedii]|uniref:Pleckstrin homology-like domain n=1 Tax=Plasmopara halstedii TaxID=4781 RepID=A0A0P1B635_PLAHL|nr:Pleckstrin homology-like domain [Plasmopara halstedii]CEG49517.1 Pleckstrin homology-like domain [Plasmopara halstedii]|eukprot:XP_024585886.1 Pleckstrin homology-like domain [Plasmopara halstedii]
MQSWSGGRRERSSSVVLLGKLSAIVRRGSVLHVDPEDACSHSNSSSNNSEDKEVNDEMTRRRHTRRRSVGATPSMQSSIHSKKSKNFGRNSNQRLQFYPARPVVVAALAMPLSLAELMRRATLESQLNAFGAMHVRFAPSQRPQDDLEEKGVLVEEEIKKNGNDMDNNERENLEEEERRATLLAVDEELEDEEVYQVHADHEESLDFDAKNMPTSVKKLMDRIKSESLVDEADEPFGNASDTSNQDDDESSVSNEDDIHHIDDVEKLNLDNNDELNEERVSSQLKETTYQGHQDSKLSCHDLDQVAMSTQDQLTASVRRLVIQLKDDSDYMNKPMAQSHGTRSKSKSLTRRRAGSCPTAYDLGVRSPIGRSPVPIPPCLSPPLNTREVVSGKKHRKNAFLRFGPRMLETLHLRKKRKTYLFTDEELETIEGARWKIVELAFRFGGKHRSYLVQAINMFFPLLKYGRRGGAHTTRLHCNCCGTLQWQHKRGSLSEAVDLAEVLQVLDGRMTPVFRKYVSNNVLNACSFSVVFRGRTLDLETQTTSHRDWLVSALRTLIAYARRQRSIEQQAIAERTKLPLEDEVSLNSFPTAPKRERSTFLLSPVAAQPM